MKLHAWLFWISVAFIFYTYFGYPLLLTFAAKLRASPINKGKIEAEIPEHAASVTMVIAAHNEEQVIGKKLENSLALDYPGDKLQIIVASDASTDSTNEIIEGFSDAGVKLIEITQRVGKAYALNVAVSEAKSELILFSDSRQLYNKDAIRELVANFNDENVGGVSGELHLIDDSDAGVGKSVGLYWQYEKFLRKMEGQLDSTLGTTGAIYAIRRELFSPIAEDTILDDFVIPMRIVLKGYRIVFEPQAHAYDRATASSKDEFTRKARTLAGNYQAFFQMRELFNPFKNRVFFQFLSHKVFRLLVPFALLSALFSNIFLTPPIYRATLFLQIAFYACAAVGFRLSKFKVENTRHTTQNAGMQSFQNFCGSAALRLFSLSFTFTLLNGAAVVGLYRFIRGKQQITWKKTTS